MPTWPDASQQLYRSSLPPRGQETPHPPSRGAGGYGEGRGRACRRHPQRGAGIPSARSSPRKAGARHIRGRHGPTSRRLGAQDRHASGVSSERDSSNESPHADGAARVTISRSITSSRCPKAARSGTWRTSRLSAAAVTTSNRIKTGVRGLIQRVPGSHFDSVQGRFGVRKWPPDLRFSGL